MLQISRLYVYEPSIENYRKITAAELSQLLVSLWPKGGWILTDSIIQNYAKCSICGAVCEINKFCGNCGALMQPEGEPDEHTNLLP